MARSLLVALLVLFIAFPALAKSNTDTCPVSCSDLWAAVSDTLGNPGNYTVMAKNDGEMTASFTIVGVTRVFVNSVTLATQDSGCEMKLRITDSGNGFEDERSLRKHINRSLDKSLDKLKAATPVQTPKSSGTN